MQHQDWSSASLVVLDLIQDTSTVSLVEENSLKLNACLGKRNKDTNSALTKERAWSLCQAKDEEDAVAEIKSESVDALDEVTNTENAKEFSNMSLENEGSCSNNSNSNSVENNNNNNCDNKYNNSKINTDSNIASNTDSNIDINTDESADKLLHKDQAFSHADTDSFDLPKLDNLELFDCSNVLQPQFDKEEAPTVEPTKTKQRLTRKQRLQYYRDHPEEANLDAFQVDRSKDENFLRYIAVSTDPKARRRLKKGESPFYEFSAIPQSKVATLEPTLGSMPLGQIDGISNSQIPDEALSLSVDTVCPSVADQGTEYLHRCRYNSHYQPYQPKLDIDHVHALQLAQSNAKIQKQRYDALQPYSYEDQDGRRYLPLPDQVRDHLVLKYVHLYDQQRAEALRKLEEGSATGHYTNVPDELVRSEPPEVFFQDPSRYLNRPKHVVENASLRAIVFAHREIDFVTKESTNTAGFSIPVSWQGEEHALALVAAQAKVEESASTPQNIHHSLSQQSNMAQDTPKEQKDNFSKDLKSERNRKSREKDQALKQKQKEQEEAKLDKAYPHLRESLEKVRAKVHKQKALQKKTKANQNDESAQDNKAQLAQVDQATQATQIAQDFLAENQSQENQQEHVAQTQYSEASSSAQNIQTNSSHQSQVQKNVVSNINESHINTEPSVSQGSTTEQVETFVFDPNIDYEALFLKEAQELASKGLSTASVQAKRLAYLKYINQQRKRSVLEHGQSLPLHCNNSNFAHSLPEQLPGYMEQGIEGLPNGMPIPKGMAVQKGLAIPSRRSHSLLSPMANPVIANRVMMQNQHFAQGSNIPRNMGQAIAMPNSVQQMNMNQQGSLSVGANMATMSARPAMSAMPNMQQMRARPQSPQQAYMDQPYQESSRPSFMSNNGASSNRNSSLSYLDDPFLAELPQSIQNEPRLNHARAPQGQMSPNNIAQTNMPMMHGPMPQNQMFGSSMPNYNAPNNLMNSALNFNGQDRGDLSVNRPANMSSAMPRRVSSTQGQDAPYINNHNYLGVNNGMPLANSKDIPYQAPSATNPPYYPQAGVNNNFTPAPQSGNMPNMMANSRGMPIQGALQGAIQGPIQSQMPGVMQGAMQERRAMSSSIPTSMPRQEQNQVLLGQQANLNTQGASANKTAENSSLPPQLMAQQAPSDALLAQPHSMEAQPIPFAQAHLSQNSKNAPTQEQQKAFNDAIAKGEQLPKLQAKPLTHDPDGNPIDSAAKVDNDFLADAFAQPQAISQVLKNIGLDPNAQGEKAKEQKRFIHENNVSSALEELVYKLKGNRNIDVNRTSINPEQIDALKRQEHAEVALSIRENSASYYHNYMLKMRADNRINPNWLFSNLTIDSNNLFASEKAIEFCNIIADSYYAYLFCLTGGLGTGKSAFSHAVANEYLRQKELLHSYPRYGKSLPLVLLIDLGDLKKSYVYTTRETAEYREEREKRFQEFCEVDLLIVDNVCTTNGLDLIEQKAFAELLFQRRKRGLSMMITSSISPEKLHDSIGDICFENIKGFQVIVASLGGESRRPSIKLAEKTKGMFVK